MSFDLFARPEFIDHVVDERQIFVHQIAQGHFDALAEIDQLAIEAVAQRRAIYSP